MSSRDHASELVSPEPALSALTVSHIPRIAALEKACFPVPWSTAALISSIRRPSAIALGLFNGDEIMAYIIANSVSYQGDIETLAVDPRWQRCGYGGLILDSAIDRLVQRKVREVWLDVRVSNLAAIALYNKRGFNAVGIREDYYPKPWREDASVMVLTITTDLNDG